MLVDEPVLRIGLHSIMLAPCLRPWGRRSRHSTRQRRSRFLTFTRRRGALLPHTKHLTAPVCLIPSYILVYRANCRSPCSSYCHLSRYRYSCPTTGPRRAHYSCTGLSWRRDNGCGGAREGVRRSALTPEVLNVNMKKTSCISDVDPECVSMFYVCTIYYTIPNTLDSV